MSIISEPFMKSGQDSYKRKDYNAALLSFNSAFSQADNATINVLDHRAATYEKLGNLQAALADGRRMIRLSKTSCVGYLRTGKILLLLKENKKARDIYDLGCRNTNSSDPHYENLQRMLRQTSRVAKDPLSVLPFELLEFVMNYLTLKQLVPLTGVSKQWRDFLQSVPSLWTRLELTGTERSVLPTTFRKYIQFSQNKVTDIVINQYQRNLSFSLQCLIWDLPRLRHLRLERPETLQTILFAQNLQSLVLSISFTIPLRWVESILCECSTLQNAEFHSVRRPVKSLTFPTMLALRSLYMTFGIGDHTGEIANIAPLLAKIPEVRKLVLKNLQGLDAISSPDVVAMTHLEELRLRDCYGILYPQALPSLRILRVCGHRVLIQPSSHSEIPGYRGPSLVELTLKDNHFSDMLLISRLLGSRSGTLRTLKISGCNRVNLSWLLVKIMQRGALDEVVDLDLGATDVTDQAIEISTPTLRNLRCISLDRTNVTGIAVKALILKPGTKLEYLGISECDRISADAVEFARKQPGLTLKSGSNSDAKGRKVRYG